MATYFAGQGQTQPLALLPRGSTNPFWWLVPRVLYAHFFEGSSPGNPSCIAWVFPVTRVNRNCVVPSHAVLTSTISIVRLLTLPLSAVTTWSLPLPVAAEGAVVEIAAGLLEGNEVGEEGVVGLLVV